MSRARSRPQARTRPGAPGRAVPGRPGADRPFVISAHPPSPSRRARPRIRVHLRPPRPTPPPPLARPSVRIAVLGAAFSAVLAGGMAVAALVCAGGVCHALTDPGPTQAVFELDDQPPGLVAPVSPGRPPTAAPAR